MANGEILTAEQERQLRQPIDEYVGKIQKEIDELREHGTAEVIEYQNLIESVKRDKTLSKGEKEYEIKEFEAKLKIVKKDDESKKPVLKKGTEFKVYDLDRKKYVEQVTTYPTTVVHKSYFTDETGYLILPQNLDAGHYRIEEVTAPDGYTLNENYYEVSVASDTAYQMDSISGDVIIEVVYENHPVKGELQIVKKGEILEDFDKDFSYQEINLSGAVFDLYAAEDIYTADAQNDEQGNRILEYAEGTKVATLTTDQEGKASVSDLPLGTYELVEITAPEGFVKNPEPQKVTFKYEDQNTPVIEQEVLLKNERQKAKISVVKRDAETKKEIKGAVFGLYAKEDIQVGNQILVKADTLIGKAETGEDGKATFSFDLPFGKYYVKELEAPEGYVSSEQVLDVSAKANIQHAATKVTGAIISLFYFRLFSQLC